METTQLLINASVDLPELTSSREPRTEDWGRSLHLPHSPDTQRTIYWDTFIVF